MNQNKPKISGNVVSSKRALFFQLASLSSNHTDIAGKHLTASSAHDPFEHPLDNPVIATSLIAAVVTVCLVAMLSLLILVLLQRRRRSRKGEWIVNKKNRNTSAGAHQVCVLWLQRIG